MNLRDFIQKVKRLEIENNFFSMRNENDLVYWDIVRYETTIRLYRHIVKTASAAPAPKRKLKSLFFHAVRSYFAYKSAVSSKKSKYLAFTFSRYRNKDGIYTDFAARDVLNLIGNEATIIDTNFTPSIQYEYPVVFNLPLRIAIKKGLLIDKAKNKLRHPVRYEAAEILLKEFGVTDFDLNKVVHDLILWFNIEYKYYQKLFRKTGPEAVFFVQAGMQKAMISAAAKQGIPTIELQHGLINSMHLAYAYTPGQNYAALNTIPTAFISFSDFWTKNTYFPVKKVFPLGNSYFSDIQNKKTPIYELTVISSIIHSEDMVNMIQQLRAAGFKGKICLKLHPNQIQEVEYFKKYFNDDNNVDVILDEQNLKYLLSVSNSILAIQSTSVYEALQAGVKVFIYRVKDYDMHQDLFSDRNVYFVSKAEEVLASVNSEFHTEEREVFFKQFEEASFADVLDFIQHYKNT